MRNLARVIGFIVLILNLGSGIASASSHSAPPNQQGDICPGFESRLVPRQQARVTPGLPNNLRRNPSLQADRIGSIPGEGVFTVLSGPRCRDGLTWWRVNYNGVVGWTAEGEGTDHWLEAVAGSDQGTVGTISSNSQSGQANENIGQDSQGTVGTINSGSQGGQADVNIGGNNGQQGVISSDDFDDDSGLIVSDEIVPIRQRNRPGALDNISTNVDIQREAAYACYNGDASSDFRIGSGMAAFDLYGEIANGGTVELRDQRDFAFWTSQMPGICSADPVDLASIVAISPNGREIRPFIYQNNGMTSIHLPLAAYSRPGVWQLRANWFQINIRVPRLDRPAFLLGSYPNDQGRVWIGGFQASEQVVIADLNSSNAGYREYSVRTNAQGYFTGQLQVTEDAPLVPTAFVGENGSVAVSSPMDNNTEQLLYDTYFGP